LALALRGLDVQVLEAEAQPRELPACIEVGPSMLRDLVRLGVADACALAGFAFRGIDVADQYGRRVHEVPIPRLAGDRYPAAVGIEHAELHRVLEKAAVAAGARVVRGRSVRELREVGGAASLVLDDGSSSDADLALLAEGGAGSLARAWFPQWQPPRDLGQRWWYTLVRRPLGLDRPLITMGRRTHRVVLVPVRASVASLALVEPADTVVKLPASHLRDSLKSFDEPIRSLVSQIGSNVNLTSRPARSGMLAVPWYRGPVLAIGECVHTMPPHFGQAGAQAIEDACVLGELVAQTRQRETLLAAFQQRRFERVRTVHELTTTAAQWDLAPDSSTDFGRLMERLTGTLAVPA
jgi:2-polyprenyl-6-methoxyphenol hydroxylase-like FAD-dependent oxidoreductase